MPFWQLKQLLAFWLTTAIWPQWQLIKAACMLPFIILTHTNYLDYICSDMFATAYTHQKRKKNRSTVPLGVPNSKTQPQCTRRFIRGSKTTVCGGYRYTRVSISVCVCVCVIFLMAQSHKSENRMATCLRVGRISVSMFCCCCQSNCK